MQCDLKPTLPFPLHSSHNCPTLSLCSYSHSTSRLGFRAQEFICAVSAAAHTLCLKPHYIPKSTGGFQLSFSQSFLPPAAPCLLISGSSLPRGYSTDLETEYWALSSFMISCGALRLPAEGCVRPLKCKASSFSSLKGESLWVKGWDVGKGLDLGATNSFTPRALLPNLCPLSSVGL